MGTIKLPKETMEEILDEYPAARVIEDEIVDQSRWSIIHRIVFRHDEKLYSATYSVGATEQQEERPWEYVDEVECTEVRPVEKTVTVYESVEAAPNN